MHDLLSHVSILIIGYYIGWYFRQAVAMKRLNDLFEKANHDMKTKIAENTIEIFIEKQGDIFYVYDKKDNSFLARGKNFSEINKILSTDYPYKIFSCSNEEMRKLKS